ncbi:hypothetical protein RHGRI_023466 [Rhododendron griersonianum]|uniref:Thiamine pyrophosphate enzyme central domain-containing protein n=1 Tax=Rhododendron griersonianum TaxID=479676 RepID=A0AAV6J945_9ERIC|nr:hypothetical protein RHGRI_023466 [Rhododendron griersonianum]KAG5535710.1 hypothetical protein RHGRI_023466 [Rhododendron griersonianum]
MEFFSLVLYLSLTTTLLTLLSLLSRSRAGPKLPPGPAPLPVVGNLLKLGDKPHKSLAELAKIHGPIMSLKLGRKTAVVISSPALAKEVLQKQDLAFSSRTVPNAAHAHDHNKYSVVWLPVADRWRSLRKIMNSHIFSGSRLDANQNLRQKKVQELIDYAGKCCQDGIAVDIGGVIFTTSLNLLSNTIFSVDIANPNQDSAKQYRDLVWQIMVEAGKPNLVDYFPALAKIDPQGVRSRMTDYFGKMFELFGRLIDERLELRRLGESGGEKDVIDILLNINEENNEEIDRTHIEHLCLDLFAAGTDTTSSSVEWAMAELLHSPDTLEKAKAELEKTIGKRKTIQESDIAQLPYLRAIVKETMRLHPPGPFLIPHRVETNVEIFGYTVPQGAQVLVNAWAIGRDPSVWTNPTSFMPERFLDSDIDIRGRDFELIPFGAGRRICPGLSLAVRVIPVMLGSLINSFDWKLEGEINPEELDMEDNNGQQPDLLVAAPQLTPDDARSLLSFFAHDQLLSIVQSAALRHPDVLSAFRTNGHPRPDRIYRYSILLFDLETDALIKKALRGVKVKVTHRGNIRRKYRISRLSNKMGLEADVEAATAFLDKAVKPVMVGGSKLRVAKAYDAFVELADDSGYVVAVMPSAKGMFPEHHPHFIGTYWGAVSTAFCAEIVESTDAYLFSRVLPPPQEGEGNPRAA